MARVKLATVWLGGCSGCHMSFLDMDEWLIELATRAELVYSPFADVKEFPEGVDITLVEGAVSNEENLAFIKQVRDRTRILVSFGDCAVTGNVTAMRNPLRTSLEVLETSYVKKGDLNPRIPEEQGIVPRLLEQVVPVHQVVRADVYLPGCPPPQDRIREVLDTLLRGEPVQLDEANRKFG